VTLHVHGGGEAIAADAATGAPKLDIPFTKYTLKNGLTVILHQDRSLPLVAVNISVKVGSRHEEPRRTGFAHLFEHLMFMGTKRAPTKMFDAWMEAEGGWNNAFTSEDRTGYYDVGPAHVLPLLLWLEADRFASLPADMNEEKLNAQREVVRNERRQTSENTPYGKVELRLPELMYPKGHPYHHPIIGSHEDLQAATVGDVKSFFARWYVPNNASLVVAGDFDKANVEEIIQRFFGPIPRGEIPAAPQAQAQVRDAKLTQVVRETIPDNVQFPKVVMAWHSAPRFEPGDAELDLCSVVLQEGKASRLYKALVYDKRLAQDVSAYQASGDLGSQFVVEAIAAPKVTPAKLEEAMDIEVAKIAAEPVSAEELTRAKNQFETAFVTRLQSVVQRASILNQYEAQRGDPGYAEKDLQRYRAVTAEALLGAAKRTLDPKARVVLHVVPKVTEPEASQPAKKEGAK
jgi:predicted Zn-dependent peptidase